MVAYWFRTWQTQRVEIAMTWTNVNELLEEPQSGQMSSTVVVVVAAGPAFESVAFGTFYLVETACAVDAVVVAAAREMTASTWARDERCRCYYYHHHHHHRYSQPYPLMLSSSWSLPQPSSS